ncbi:hypothetical protein LDY98_05255, partial [Pseudomonas aeruginosa]|nr:hypothetical protein [Pseudomonas aeruginosa]
GGRRSSASTQACGSSSGNSPSTSSGNSHQRLASSRSISSGTLLDELERRNLRYGLATLCVGGGMGIATIIERV